jgi:Mce-associated membrane protein
VEITPFRLLAAGTIALGVIALLLALMVFAPRIAPLKLGATRLAAEAQTNEQVTEVAKRFATNFLSLDYRTIDADFDRVLEDTTGNFERQLRRLLEVTKDRLVEAKGVSEGRVTRLSVLTRTEDTATVQVVVSRSIQNSDTPDPQVVEQSLEVTLVSTPGGWKVDDTTGIPSATSGDR